MATRRLFSAVTSIITGSWIPWAIACGPAEGSNEQTGDEPQVLATSMAEDSVVDDLATIDIEFATDYMMNRKLEYALHHLNFTGKVESTLTARLGRSLDKKLAELGRLLWFDKLTALHDDNACGGCHAPSHGFGDTQSIAIGIQNNNLVGPNAPVRATSAARRRSSTARSFPA